MRGKPELEKLCADVPGITPAGAGKTSALRSMCAGLRDHPRRCGENRNKHSENRRGVGSPPQVRGKPLNSSSCRRRSWITPAGAGKTRHVNGVRRYARGSPPQVRGKLFCHNLISSAYRITPAGAGKTRESVARPAVVEDHPRRCGENAFLIGRMMPSIGSPPQVRGKPRFKNDCLTMNRITPAGAGKTVQVVRCKDCP